MRQSAMLQSTCERAWIKNAFVAEALGLPHMQLEPVARSICRPALCYAEPCQ